MRVKFLVGIVGLLLIFLAGCYSQPAVPESPNLPITATFQNSPSPMRKIIPTQVLSATLSPKVETKTAIASNFSRVMQTQDNFMHVSAPATLEARGVRCKEGFVVEQYLDIISYSNDRWTLFTCSPVPSHRENKWTPGVVDYGTRYTQLVKTDFSQSWTIQHNQFDYSMINRANALMVPLRWTEDGQALYLYPKYYPGPSGFPRSAFLSSLIHDLYRIDLKTGEFRLVLDQSQYHDLAISPDDQFLVYSEDDRPEVLHLRNLKSGSDQQVKLDEEIVAAGAFLWNAGSTKVALAAGYGKKSVDWQDDLSGTSIFVLDPQTMRAQKVLVRDDRIFKPIQCSDQRDWLDENTICLNSESPDDAIGSPIFTLNIQTGVVEFLRPTP